MTTKKNNGSELERNVRAILKDLQSRGLCYLWKLPTDLRLTRNGIHHGEPMPADFMGWRRDGRVILIECKDVDRPRLPLGKAPGLTPFQLQAVRFAAISDAYYITLWKRGQQFAFIRFGFQEEQMTSYPWSGIPSDLISPMERLPQELEVAIMGTHETPPLPNGSPAVPRVRRMRHRSAIRRAGPPPASH